MPDPSQPHRKKTSREMFYRQGHERKDAELHEAILAEGDHEAAAEVSRKWLRERGLDKPIKRKP